MLGTLVADGHTYVITRLELFGGMMVITAEGSGPTRRAENVPMTVFGPDGTGVCQG
jgi:hypothetical protein